MRQQPFSVERDGMTIRGMSYQPDAAARHPTVVLLHGFTGHRIENGFLYVRLGRALAERGIAAVTFDFLHSGESDGSFDEMLVTGEVADAMRITEWVAGQPFVDRSRLGLLGFSLGGLVAACVVGRIEAYRALALLAPTTVKNLCRFAGQGQGGRITFGSHRLHEQFFDDLRTLRPIEDVVRHPRPTLLVQGEADEAVPPSVSQAYVDAMRAANVPLQFEHIADADHVFGRPEQRTQLLDDVTGFFQDQLAR